MLVYQAVIVAGTPEPRQVAAVTWVPRADLPSLKLPPADYPRAHRRAPTGPPCRAVPFHGGITGRFPRGRSLPGAQNDRARPPCPPSPGASEKVWRQACRSAGSSSGWRRG